MVNISLPTYDECRKWIKIARSKKKSWDEIRYGLRSNEEELEQFLQQQKLMSFWPNDLTKAVWFEIVSSEMTAEEKSLVRCRKRS